MEENKNSECLNELAEASATSADLWSPSLFPRFSSDLVVVDVPGPAHVGHVGGGRPRRGLSRVLLFDDSGPSWRGWPDMCPTCVQEL